MERLFSTLNCVIDRIFLLHSSNPNFLCFLVSLCCWVNKVQNLFREIIQPFVRDRSHLHIAHEIGFGTVDLKNIDFQSEVQPPVADFRTEETDPYETVLAWRRTTCEQALYYRDHRHKFLDRYAGEYILLQDNEVRWHDKKSDLRYSRRELAGTDKQSAMWFKLVDPEEAEGEHFEVYERELALL